jgi:hypothetical protein
LDFNQLEYTFHVNSGSQPDLLQAAFGFTDIACIAQTVRNQFSLFSFDRVINNWSSRLNFGLLPKPRTPVLKTVRIFSNIARLTPVDRLNASSFRFCTG